MSAEFEILHSLRVKGLAGPQVLSALSGVTVDRLGPVCATLVADGLVKETSGAMSGYLLTPAGRNEADRLLAEDPATRGAREELERFDAEFLPLNSEFKQLCQRWQMRTSEEPNDHSDAEYDRSVIADLANFHASTVPVIEHLAMALPRFARYGRRLSAALSRLQGGDAAGFARPMADSYHDIWMELHNDVVLSLQRERSAADEG
jgi:DNA-binding PadR family transcriptional regulator